MKYLYVIGLMITSVCFFGCNESIKNGESVNRMKDSVVSSTGNIINSSNRIEEIVKDERNEVREDVRESVLDEVVIINKNAEELSWNKINASLSIIIKEKDSKLKESEKVNEALKKSLKNKDSKIEELQNKERLFQTHLFTYCGVGALAIAGVLMYLGQRGLAGTAAVTGVGLLFLSQLLASPYFLYIGILFTVGIFGYFLFVSYKNKKEKDAVKLIVDTLEESYSSASEEERKIMDDKIFDVLSKRMDTVHKKIVRELKQ